MPAPTSAPPSTPAGFITSRLDFPALIEQTGRLLQVDTALPELALIPERLAMREALSTPFELTLDCIATSAYFELTALIGEQITVRLLQPDGSYRPWHGYVQSAGNLGADGGLATYRLVMLPWLSFLRERDDSFVYQDKTALQIIEEIFKDYAQANYRIEVTETLRVRSLCNQYRESDLAFVERLLAEEGLSYRFEHLGDSAAADADAAGHARHVLVITDRAAVCPDLGDARFTSQHPIANLAGQRDAITAFAATRHLTPNAVSIAAWDYKQLSGTSAGDASSLALGDVPALESYDGAGAYRYENAEHAERAAGLRLAAHELDIKRFEGQGSTRHFAEGCGFNLVDHPLYGSGSGASRERPDNAFTLVAVEHHAANNLGSQAAEARGVSELEHGTYKNHFHAVPAAAPRVPRFERQPTVFGSQSALVTGRAGQALTTDRDHRVKIQFPWQRGEAPLAGGLAHGGSVDPIGNAPGDERSGTWARVSLPVAGTYWGAALLPRSGTEVAVDFIEGDVDRPIVLGQFHNGQDAPPFAAGEESGVNHPGVISGLHAPTLDGGGFNQWVVDDAAGQLRTRLLSSQADSELSLGHLIQQNATSAQRGGWRGSGFEGTTQGWVSLRAAQGLLISATERAGTYGSAQSTQMDAAEALAQLKAAQSLGSRLGEVALASGAQGLPSFDEGQSVDRLLQAIDPQRDGKHPGPVNGQDAIKPGSDGRSPGSEPVEAFAAPLVLLETPSTAAWTSEASVTAYAGTHLSLAAQGDVQQTAAATYASVSGQTTSLYAHQGGIQAIAANGPLSLRAHTDRAEILGEQAIAVVSVNDTIAIHAKNKVELIVGQSGLTLEGENITFTTPGAFVVQGATHAFLDGAGNPASLTALPEGKVDEAPNDVELHYQYDDLSPVAGAPYKVTFEAGGTRTGSLNDQGYALLSGVPKGAYTVEYGEDARDWKAPPPAPDDAPYRQGDVQSQGHAAIERMLATQPAPEAMGSAA